MIEVIDLHKSFGGQPVLAGVNLRVESGETCALLGASGSGKTVLLKHLIGLYRPDRGMVRIDGHDLATLSPAELHRVRLSMGILFQGGGLFDSMSVHDNVAFPLREQLHLSPDEVERRVKETLHLVHLEDAADELPGELSGGMRKRVAFARAIVTEPKLLLFDEPTAGLDPLMTDSVAEELELAKHHLGVTQLAITHDLPTAFRVADTLALLYEGRVALQAPPVAFRASQMPEVRTFLRDWIVREQYAREDHPTPTH